MNREFSKKHDYGQVFWIGGEPAWRCQNGRTIPIREMEDKHVRNTILMLQHWHVKQVASARRVQAAVDGSESDSRHIDEFERAGPAIAIAAYPYLLKEAQSRGLGFKEEEREDDGISRRGSEDRRGDEAPKRRHLEHHARSLWLPVHHQDG